MAKKSATKKLRYEIVPFRGIGPVHLGMSRKEVARVMAGEPGAMPSDSHGDSDYFFEASLHVEYSSMQTVSFIETAPSKKAAFFFEGVNVHKLSANKLLEHIKRYDQPQLGGAEPESYPLFPKLILTLGERRSGPSRWDAVGIGDQQIAEAESLSFCLLNRMNLVTDGMTAVALGFARCRRWRFPRLNWAVWGRPRRSNESIQLASANSVSNSAAACASFSHDWLPSAHITESVTGPFGSDKRGDQQ